MGTDYVLATRIERRNQEAVNAEETGDIEKATRIYEQNIREDYADKFSFERLMVIYRKQKEYADELRVINRGVEVFQQHLEQHVTHSLSRRIGEEKLRQLSAAITKKSLLKKESLSFPDPIHKWIKRKEIVLAKLKHN